MHAHSDSFSISTRGKGTYNITSEVARIVRESGINTGTATVLLQHTSASLVIYENADPSARTDLHEFFERIVPEDADYYVHTTEGSDDTTSHLKMALNDCRRVNDGGKCSLLCHALTGECSRFAFSCASRCVLGTP